MEHSYIDGDTVRVPVLSLRPGNSPRLKGEDKAHVARLAELDAPLPPILVDQSTMRVIDGMHRLQAASLRGQDEIEVIFFTGSDADIFLRAVEENISHGLPLSRQDRRAAATRIIQSWPELSDRAIARSTGLSPKTVSEIRRSADQVPDVEARVGRDGRTRPLDHSEGRIRAAEFLAAQPTASLRQAARVARISPATAKDVRLRMLRGESPLNVKGAEPAVTPPTQTAAQGENQPRPATRIPGANSPDPLGAVGQMTRDPSIRQNQQGRVLLQLLRANATGVQDLYSLVTAVPPHRVATVGQLARQYASMWTHFAEELKERSKVIDPRGSW